MHWDYGWGMGFGLGWISMVVFWILLILGIVYLVKMIAGGTKKGETTESSLEILKKRYAKGEISKDEFERIRADLKQ